MFKLKSFYIKQCQDIFGPQFNSDLLNDSVRNTNINYGGYSYEGSRVVFVNGEIDPWHALGFYKAPPNENTNTIFIKGSFELNLQILIFVLNLILCRNCSLC